MFIIRVLMSDNRWNRPFQPIKLLHLAAYCNISSKDKINEEIDVGIVMDGPVRDDLKCASMKWAPDRERAQLRALFTKAEQ
jgi:hypothetical protein